mgnify:CR=1 FL=1
MKNKLFLILGLLLLILFLSYFSVLYCGSNNEFCVGNSAVAVANQAVALLLPLSILSLLAVFMNKITFRSYFITIIVSVALLTILISQLPSQCSESFCYDRTQTALMLSSAFSFIYFIFLFIKNDKRV